MSLKRLGASLVLGIAFLQVGCKARHFNGSETKAPPDNMLTDGQAIFSCSGGETMWTLEIGPQNVKFKKTATSTPRVFEMTEPRPAIGTPLTALRVYRFNEGAVVFIRERECLLGSKDDAPAHEIYFVDQKSKQSFAGCCTIQAF